MEKDIIKDAKLAFKEAEDAFSEQRQRMAEDMRFSRLGEQWPDEIKRDREKEGRPCLTINRQPAFIRQVVNDSRQNKPSIKVHPVDDYADPDTAKVLDGLIRNIEHSSSADTAYDTAIDHAASSGIGYWRVDIEHSYHDTFDLDLKIKRIANPFTVYGDPRSEEADSSDWNDAFITELLNEREFKARYKDAKAGSWFSDKDDRDELWFDNEAVRVAEYWKRREVEKNLLKLSDGTVVLEDTFLKADPETGMTGKDLADVMGITVATSRKTKSFDVMQYIVTGADVLEENKWAGMYIPIVPVYGEEVNIEGRKYYMSLIHQAKDSQRMENYWRTVSTELVALAPKAPFVGEEDAFSVDPNWETANTTNHAYLMHKNGTRAPQRQPFAGTPAGAIQEALMAVDDQKAILGLFDASLGAKSNETSGRAIIARQREGDTSTFHFIDNLTRSIRHTGRILIDLIPYVYNEERIIRVMGEDGKPDSVPINQPQQDERGIRTVLHDLTAGKYDLVVKSGPGFTSRREEAAYQMTEMMRSVPEAGPIIGPHLAKNLDWPGADEIAEDLKLISPVEQMKRQAEQGAQPDPDVMKAQQETQAKQQQFQAEMQFKQQEHRDKMMLEKYKIDTNAALQQELAGIKQQGVMLEKRMEQLMSGSMMERGPIVQVGDKDLSEAISAPMVQGMEALTQAAGLISQAATQMAQTAAAPKMATLSNGKQITLQTMQ